MKVKKLTKESQENKIETIAEVDIDELREKAIFEAKTKKHEWRQRGNRIVCVSCEYEHGFFIDTKKIMVGIDKKGMPIIEDRKQPSNH